MQTELLITNIILALTILAVLTFLVYLLKKKLPSKVVVGSGYPVALLVFVLFATLIFGVLIYFDSTEKVVITYYLRFLAAAEVFLWSYLVYVFRTTKDRARRFFSVYCLLALINSLTIFFVLINIEITFIVFGIINLSGILKLITFLAGVIQFKMLNISKRALFFQKDFADEAFIYFGKNEILMGYNDLFKGLYGDIKLYKTTLKDFLLNYPEFESIEVERTKEYRLEIDGNERCFFAEVFQIYYIIRKQKLYITEVAEIQRIEGMTYLGTLIKIKDITHYKEHTQKMQAATDEAMYKAEANEISFLQAQIKPHFLYNTLNTISSLIFAEPDAAKELIADLSDYFRSSFFFDNSNGLIHIKEELAMVETYARIEKARYGDRLNFKIINKQCPDIMIPRLVIQPLIENAIKHGIQKKEAGGKVTLLITQTEDEILVEVTDDGVGIAQECIPGLLLRNDKEHGIGLSNIDKRLYSYYGKGLIIKSQLGEGTAVSFCIPKNK